MSRYQRTLLALAALLPASVATAQSVIAPLVSTAMRDSSRAALLRDVKFLASPALGGRAIGAPGLDSAALFLARQYRELQIDALLTGSDCDTGGRCQRTYFQTFAPPTRILTAAGIDTMARAHNVMAVVLGTDPALSGQWIVIGAHYDHLGETGLGVKDPRFAKQPHLGADDNASGTAAVLELARRIANDPPRRPVIFVHFAAEEIGLIGSNVFVQDPPVAIDSITAMINLDMVGRLARRRLQLFGLESSPDWERLIADVNLPPRTPVIQGKGVTGSDHVPFMNAGVPAIHFFTGMHSAYHTKDDTVESLDVEGMLTVVEFADRLIRHLANADVRPRRVRPRSARSTP